MKMLPDPPDTWERVWVRSLILACGVCLLGQFWASGQAHSIDSAMREGLDPIGSFCGVILFLSSIGSFWQNRRLAVVGLFISVPSIALMLLPKLAV